MADSVFVEGEPVLSGGKGQDEWQDKIRRRCPSHLPAPSLTFIVSALRRRGHPFDLDNLIHPVLMIFDDPIDAVRARLYVGARPGLLIESDEIPVEPPTTEVNQRPQDLTGTRTHRTRRGSRCLVRPGLRSRHPAGPRCPDRIARPLRASRLTATGQPIDGALVPPPPVVGSSCPGSPDPVSISRFGSGLWAPYGSHAVTSAQVSLNGGISVDPAIEANRFPEPSTACLGTMSAPIHCRLRARWCCPQSGRASTWAQLERHPCLGPQPKRDLLPRPGDLRHKQ